LEKLNLERKKITFKYIDIFEALFSNKYLSKTAESFNIAK